MASKEFAQPVRGSGANPVSTSVNGSIETNNYTEGGAFSGAPPANVDPAETIQEVLITASGSDSTMTVTTTTGTNFTVNLNAGTLVLDTVQIASLSFGGTSTIEGNWVGE